MKYSSEQYRIDDDFKTLDGIYRNKTKQEIDLEFYNILLDELKMIRQCLEQLVEVQPI